MVSYISKILGYPSETKLPGSEERTKKLVDPKVITERSATEQRIVGSSLVAASLAYNSGVGATGLQYGLGYYLFANLSAGSTSSLAQYNAAILSYELASGIAGMTAVATAANLATAGICFITVGTIGTIGYNVLIAKSQEEKVHFGLNSIVNSAKTYLFGSSVSPAAA